MRNIFLTLGVCFAANIAMAADNSPNTVSGVFDKNLSSVEGEFLSLADAMPADKYDFAPTSGEFKGVRTFAQQVKHVAAANYGICASALGEKIPVDTGKDESGPDSLKQKDEIGKYAKESFAYCHKAIASLTNDNLTDPLAYAGGGEGKRARLYWINIPIWHTFDHYGQMVVYARMNNVVPPASRKQQ